MARRHAEVFLEVLKGEGFAQPNPRPMFPNPPGLLRLEPHSAGLRDRIWWGSGSNATAEWAAQLGMNLQSSTLKEDESGEPFHVQQAARSRLPQGVGRGRPRARAARLGEPQRSSPLINDRDRAYFGRDGASRSDRLHRRNMRAIFGRSYAAEPDVLVKQLAEDEAIAEADTLLLTVPNQLGVDYNAHVIESASSRTSPPRSAGADGGCTVRAGEPRPAYGRPGRRGPLRPRLEGQPGDRRGGHAGRGGDALLSRHGGPAAGRLTG